MASSMVLLLFSGIVFTQTRPIPRPCVPAKHGDTSPWTHNSEILGSYPRENSIRYLGAFRDQGWNYQLKIYRDGKGVFGELLSPVLEADSPDSRLYDTFFDGKLGTLRFQARFPVGNLHFAGVLQRDKIRGEITQNRRSQKVILRRVRSQVASPYISRAQFECAMILFHRY